MWRVLTTDSFRSSHIQTEPKEKKKLNVDHPTSYLIAAYSFHLQVLILFSKVYENISMLVVIISSEAKLYKKDVFHINFYQG